MCAEKGHPEELSAEIYRQIESFAGYSFCKAHSASYAVESYQSLHLKVHYPIEFMLAVINNLGGLPYRGLSARGTDVRGCYPYPCINKSEVETTLYSRNVYLGFMPYRGLQGEIARFIVSEHIENDEYTSLEDFINRVPIGIEGLQLLIYIGHSAVRERTRINYW